MVTIDCPATYFSIQHRVLETEIDALGHVNNTIYLQWMEKVAWAHTNALGITLETYQHLNTAMVARHHDMTYLQACLPHEIIELRTWLGEQNALHSHRHYAFYRLLNAQHADDKSSEQLAFIGHTHWVCIAMSTGKPKRMPQVLLDGYGVKLK